MPLTIIKNPVPPAEPEVPRCPIDGQPYVNGLPACSFLHRAVVNAPEV